MASDDTEFKKLKNVRLDNEQTSDQQERQKERLFIQWKKYDAQVDDVLQILERAEEIVNDEADSSKIDKLDASIIEFNTLSEEFDEIGSKINSETDVNEIARYIERGFEIVNKLEKIVSDVENILGMDKDEIKGIKKDESNSPIGAFTVEQGKLEDGDIVGLSEQEREVIEQSITSIKRRFTNVDKEDDMVVAQFWSNISEEIKEEGGMTGNALGKVMDIIIKNVDSNKESSFGKWEQLIAFWEKTKKSGEQSASSKSIENTKSTKMDKAEINTFYDTVLIDAEENYLSIKQIKDEVKNIKRSIWKKKKEIEKAKTKSQRRKKNAELLNLKLESATRLKVILDEKKEIDKQRSEEQKKKSRKTLEKKKETVGNKQGVAVEQFKVNGQEISNEINALFDSEGIEQYIGTGKSKKSQENRNRIDTYKKEIIESIVEIENVAGRKINRGQFAIDYANEKQATAIAKILEDTVKRAYTEERLKEIQKTRDVADITFTQMDKYNTKYDSLNADTERGGDEKFKEITREVWKEFAVRGFLVKDRETGEIKVNGNTNTDCKTALYFLQKAGINVSDVAYVAPGEYDPGKINIDTGKKDGLIILGDGTVIIDHHGEDSPLDTSATAEVYDKLVRLGLLEKKESDVRLVEFINQVDNFDFPNAQTFFKNYFNNAHKTVLGTYRMLPPEALEKFFAYKNHKTGKSLSPTEPLSIALRRKFYIENQPNSKKESRGQKVKKNIEKQRKHLEQMEKDGLIVESDRYGKICVVTEGNLYNESIRAFGCDTVIFWNKDENDVFISSLVGKPITDTFAQGDNIRKTMWIKPKSSDDKLTIQLKDVLEKMTDGKLKASEKLQKILDTNGERTDRVELTEIESKYLTPYIKRVRENIGFIDTLDFSDLKGEQIAREKKKLMSMVWKELKEDIDKSMRFTSGQTKDIIELIKDKI